MVLPQARSETGEQLSIGVFASRTPHRPNPIGQYWALALVTTPALAPVTTPALAPVTTPHDPPNPPFATSQPPLSLLALSQA